MVKAEGSTSSEESESSEDTGFWGTIAGIAGDAWNGATDFISGAWDSTVNWGEQVWGTATDWAAGVWGDASAWLVQAWNDSSAWVVHAWSDTGDWVNTNWNRFAVWVSTITDGDPYDWISDTVLENGLVAYDNFVDLRSFLKTEPDLDELRSKYDEKLAELSLVNDDKTVLWDMLQQWATERNLSMQYVTEIVIPYLDRLIIKGSSAIGDDVVFSGPVVGQYLITVLEAIKLDSDDIAIQWIELLNDTLDSITRPVIIGDDEQNVLVTDDGYYIENFTYADGKYQIFMVVTESDSEYPLIKEKTIEEQTKLYFSAINSEEATEETSIKDIKSERLSFTTSISDKSVTGTTLAFWGENQNYLFFIVTDEEWNEEEFTDWLDTLVISDSVSFTVDMGSDGSFYGVNQYSQKYTINRIFDEEKFTYPRVGHGWAAEEGNNLIDNIKGFFKGEHSEVVGDNNVKDGPDRITTYSDGSTLLIQSKYYADASQSVDACFRDGKFRYLDSEGSPMAIEVPSDQYEAAIEYMKNRISNGEIPGIDPADTEKAVEIVKKGNLTYQQAKHIAKAGTVESIVYDSVNACVTASTSMGISAAVDLAVNLWNGETLDTAIKSSIYQGLETGGTSFLISVLSSQLAKTGIDTALIPASRVLVKALGPKVSATIVNAFRPAGSAIYGAAAMQSAAKLLRGNAITCAVTFVVLSSADIADIIQGKISWKQFGKDAAENAAGIAGGTLGYIGGAAIGSAIAPGVGTAVGIIVAVAAGWGASNGISALTDLIADDDADEMISIIEEAFPDIAGEYYLSEEELNQSVENLQTLLTSEMLKQMYQYDDHEEFARQLIETAIDPVVAERSYVDLPDDEEYANYVEDTLNEIYSDISETESIESSEDE